MERSAIDARAAMRIILASAPGNLATSALGQHFANRHTVIAHCVVTVAVAGAEFAGMFEPALERNRFVASDFDLIPLAIAPRNGKHLGPVRRSDLADKSGGGAGLLYSLG